MRKCRWLRHTPTVQPRAAAAQTACLPPYCLSSKQSTQRRCSLQFQHRMERGRSGTLRHQTLSWSDEHTLFLFHPCATKAPCLQRQPTAAPHLPLPWAQSSWRSKRNAASSHPGETTLPSQHQRQHTRGHLQMHPPRSGRRPVRGGSTPGGQCRCRQSR